MSYTDFLDRKTQLDGGSGFESEWVPDFLFEFQTELAHLRVIDGEGQVLDTCPGCESKDARIAQLKDDLENIERGELRRLRAQVSKLTSDRHKKLKASPAAKDAAEVYAYWRERCHPAAQEECPVDRLALILTRLGDFSADDLRRAVDGAAEAPFVDERGKRHDGIELIFRNTGKVWDFIGRAKPAEKSDGQTAEPPKAKSEPKAKPKSSGTIVAHRATPTNPDVRGLFAMLGIGLPRVWGTNVSVSCFADPGAHSREDRNASCSVSVVTGAWRCHGCGAQGGAYDAALARGLDPAPAMAALETHGLVGKQEVTVNRMQTPKEREVEQARRALAGHKLALERLQAVRGWSPAAVISLGLGLSGDRIVFGVRDAHGKLVGLNRFAPNPARRKGPKMMADTGSKRELFPAPETLEGDTVWLVEGEPDAVSARTLGLQASGVPGVQGWRPEWATRFEGRKVVVCMDCDSQGRECAERIVADLKAGVDARLVDLAPVRTDGHDLGDYVRELAETPASRKAARETLERLAGGTR